MIPVNYNEAEHREINEYVIMLAQIGQIEELEKAVAFDMVVEWLFNPPPPR